MRAFKLRQQAYKRSVQIERQNTKRQYKRNRSADRDYKDSSREVETPTNWTRDDLRVEKADDEGWKFTEGLSRLDCGCEKCFAFIKMTGKAILNREFKRKTALAKCQLETYRWAVVNHPDPDVRAHYLASGPPQLLPKDSKDCTYA
jgi:hypothetical protein